MASGDPFASLLSHAADIQRCRSTACFAALTVHFGTKSPVVLEARIDRRKPYLTKGGERSWSGIYRGWLRDSKTPHDKSVARILERSGGSVDLRLWRDLMLWRLLTPAPQLLDTPGSRASSFSRQIRRILFDELDNNLVGRHQRLRIPPARVLALRNLRSLEAFHALVYLARESELIGDQPEDLLPAVCAFELLPGLIKRYPQLRFRWGQLFSCVERVLCRRLKPYTASPPALDAASTMSADRLAELFPLDR